MPQQVPSPLVDGGVANLVRVISVPKLIAKWKRQLGIDITHEFTDLEEIALYFCAKSSFGFFRPASAAGSDALYTQLAKFEWFYMPDKWEFDMAISALSDARRILEVGSGPGLFMKRLLAKYPEKEIVGLELNLEAVKQAQNAGLHIEAVDLNDLVATGEKFDAVCNFQVLEHIPEPRDFLSSLVSSVRPGGRLIISVPNDASFVGYQDTLLNMPPHHMSRWRIETFYYLERIFPLRLVAWHLEPLAPYHVRGFVDAKMSRLLGNMSLRRVPGQGFLVRQASSLLRWTGLYRRFVGHSLFVVFERKIES
jgi:2-polyprenyl-3-methyl-5-hydroxy-6-metoxy-1,4-benzoquinol methylase